MRNEVLWAGRALGIGSAVALLPFLLLCLYWHPVGTHGVDWISNWGGKYDQVGWWAQQADWYRTTMGRYTSTAMLSTVSHWYSLPLARVVVAGLHVGLGAALYFCVRSIFPLSRRDGLLMTLVILGLYVSQLSNPYDSLYRITGLFIYHAGLMASLLFTGLLLRGRLYAASVAVVFAIGTNEITLVHCGLLLAGYLVVEPKKLFRRDVQVLVALATAAALVALCAPGNWVRADLYVSGEGRTLFASLLLTVATAGYTWITWITSTALLPLAIIGAYLLPRSQLAGRRLPWLLTLGLLPLVSFLPVILATRGESFPEGIADWQIIPVALLLSVIVSSYERPVLSGWPVRLTVVFIVGFTMFGGLSIDRDRSVVSGSYTDRIDIAAAPGNAWWQLLSGRSAEYSRSVERQYATMRECATPMCDIPPLREVTDNYLYDPSYDRRILPMGDPWFGHLVNRSLRAAVSDSTEVD